MSLFPYFSISDSVNFDKRFQRRESGSWLSTFDQRGVQLANLTKKYWPFEQTWLKFDELKSRKTLSGSSDGKILSNESVNDESAEPSGQAGPEKQETMSDKSQTIALVLRNNSASIAEDAEHPEMSLPEDLTTAEKDVTTMISEEAGNSTNDTLETQSVQAGMLESGPKTEGVSWYTDADIEAAVDFQKASRAATPFSPVQPYKLLPGQRNADTYSAHRNTRH